MPERIECIDDRFLLIADDPHFTTQGKILSDRMKDQNISYSRGISDGSQHRLAEQLRLQLEAALEAASGRRKDWRQNEVPRSVTYGEPDDSQTKPSAAA